MLIGFQAVKQQSVGFLRNAEDLNRRFEVSEQEKEILEDELQ